MSQAAMYYVVLPSQRLKEHLEGFEDGVSFEAGRQLLLTPSLFIRNMTHRVPAFWPKKAIAENHDVKLTFLATLIERFEQYDNPSLHKLIQGITGSPPYSITIFDDWWELYPIGDSTILPEASLGTTVKPHILRQFGKTGDLSFDNWLAEMIQQKEQGKQ